MSMYKFCTSFLVMLILGVFILDQVSASAEVAPRDPDTMSDQKDENDKPMVDEPGV